MKPDKMASRLPPVADSAEAYNLARTIGMLVGCVRCQRRYRRQTGAMLVVMDENSRGEFSWIADWTCRMCVEDSES